MVYSSVSTCFYNNTRTSLEHYGLCNDQWVENNHIPPQLYIREGLRLVNENMFTQNRIFSGLCRNDTVALGILKFTLLQKLLIMHLLIMKVTVI